MVSNITTLVTGILGAVGDFISLTSEGSSGLAYLPLLALPVCGGIVALALSLVRKAKR